MTDGKIITRYRESSASYYILLIIIEQCARRKFIMSRVYGCFMWHTAGQLVWLPREVPRNVSFKKIIQRCSFQFSRRCEAARTWRLTLVTRLNHATLTKQTQPWSVLLPLFVASHELTFAFVYLFFFLRLLACDFRFHFIATFCSALSCDANFITDVDTATISARSLQIISHFPLSLIKEQRFSRFIW